VHEENQKKARLGARRKPEKSTIWCTKKTTKKLELEHDLVYDHQKESMNWGTIWCTKKTVKKNVIFWCSISSMFSKKLF